MIGLLILLLSAGTMVLWTLILLSWWEGQRLPLFLLKLPLTLLMLTFVLALFALLTGCACHPTIQPNMTSVPGLAGMVESMGMLCQWAY